MDEVKGMDEAAQLALLKGLTKTTGVLHEAQALQLKYLPLIATHAVKSEFSYNFEDKELIFNLTKVKGPKPANFKKRLQILSNNAKNIVGEEYKIVVKLLGKVVHSQKGKSNDHTKRTRKNRPNRNRKKRV